MEMSLAKFYLLYLLLLLFGFLVAQHTQVCFPVVTDTSPKSRVLSVRVEYQLALTMAAPAWISSMKNSQTKGACQQMNQKELDSL